MKAHADLAAARPTPSHFSVPRRSPRAPARAPQEIDELSRDALLPEEEFEDFNFLLDGNFGGSGGGGAGGGGDTAAASAGDEVLNIPSSPGPEDAALLY